jgi:hypothetical protein
MIFFSFLGTAPFFLLIAPVFVWCIDAGWGLRIGLALTLSDSLNSFFKVAMRGSRPYWVDARVQPLSAETSFGVPSGHSMTAAAVWGVLAAWAPQKWIKALAVGMIFFIGFSRVYLGMHFPHDVLIGWLIGLGILWAILRGEQALKPWLERRHPAVAILAAFGISLAIIALNVLIRMTARNWTMPAAWATLAALAPNAAPVEPLALSGPVTSAAAFFGLAAGGFLLKLRGWFDPRGTLWKLLMRYAIGLAGMLVFYVGLDQVFPDGITPVAMIFRFIRYALIGLWVMFLAPEVFIRLRLAERGAPPPEQPVTV